MGAGRPGEPGFHADNSLSHVDLPGVHLKIVYFRPAGETLRDGEGYGAAPPDPACCFASAKAGVHRRTGNVDVEEETEELRFAGELLAKVRQTGAAAGALDVFAVRDCGRRPLRRSRAHQLFHPGRVSIVVKNGTMTRHIRGGAQRPEEVQAFRPGTHPRLGTADEGHRKSDEVPGDGDPFLREGKRPGPLPVCPGRW